jgi:hypothetical protein
MDLAYTISEDEYLRAARETVRLTRWRLFLDYLISTILAVGGLWLICIHQWVSGAISIFLAIRPLFIGRWRIRRSAKNTYQTSSFLQGEIRAHIDEHGTSFFYPQDSSNSTWNSYRCYLETDEMYILMVSSVLSRFIPKTAFSPEQRKEFERLISVHLSRGI